MTNRQEALEAALREGDYVEKFTGEARWHGWIVAAYKTRRGKQRYVVEVEPQGFQMIAVPSQLRLTDPAPSAGVGEDERLEGLRQEIREQNAKAETVARERGYQLNPRIAALRQSAPPLDEVERLREALVAIDQWSRAYSPAIFPEPDVEAVTALLTKHGMRNQMDRLHASWARHLMDGIGEQARAALSNPAHDQAECTRQGA